MSNSLVNGHVSKIYIKGSQLSLQVLNQIQLHLISRNHQKHQHFSVLQSQNKKEVPHQLTSDADTFQYDRYPNIQKI